MMLEISNGDNEDEVDNTQISSLSLASPTQNSSTPVTSPRTKRRNASYIWEFMVKNDRIKCTVEHCAKSWSVATGNSTLMSHLANHHKINVGVIESDEESNEIRSSKFQKKGTKHCDRKQNVLNQLLLKFIIDNMQAFAVVDNKCFLELMYELDPMYVVPDRKTIAENIKNNFDDQLNKIKTLIKETKSKINLTTDAWVSQSNEPFIVITSHFIDNSYVQRNLVLDFFYFPHPHDAYNISEAIRQVYYGILTKLITILFYPFVN